jgi:hypothetical protein
VSGILFFEICALACAASAFAVLALKAARVVKMRRRLTVLVCLALAGAAWCCLYLAASISASVQ